MTYNTLIFALFLLVALILYFVVPKRGRWIVLLTVSYVFYLFNSSFLIVFILITTLSVYLCGRLLGALSDRFKKEKRSLTGKAKRRSSRESTEKRNGSSCRRFLSISACCFS